MAKTYFVLQGEYDQLKVRRRHRYGRMVLDQVINDGKPYWLVSIRGFGEHDRQLLSAAVNQRWGNGTRRFVSLDSAKRYFDRLAQTPEYGGDEKKRQKARTKNSERLRQYRYTRAESEGIMAAGQLDHRSIPPRNGKDRGARVITVASIEEYLRTVV